MEQIKILNMMYPIQGLIVGKRSPGMLEKPSFNLGNVTRIRLASSWSGGIIFQRAGTPAAKA